MSPSLLLIQDTYVTTKDVMAAAPAPDYVFDNITELRSVPYPTYAHSYLGNGMDAYRLTAVQVGQLHI